MIICVCHNVNERAIRKAVEAGHGSFEAIQMELGVATCCGCCADHARNLVSELTATACACRPVARSQPLMQISEPAA
ncbi:bacterioferritin-associated ferredoxin [Piscinibacterium candidicorallinum]|uniref:Bacterioferritin-associated ferredoxin n=1 Tax=Piscinibacterium candidicorallinum TaxID=1793872 RepID=A0ABV7H2R9_9BURK